jgi:uncharacterized protein (DUF2384 family)
MSFHDSSDSFAGLHPYGWSEGELSFMLWTLFSILVLAILTYVFSAWKQVRNNGVSWRSLSGRKRPGELSQEQRERIERAEARFIVRRQQRNNNE